MSARDLHAPCPCFICKGAIVSKSTRSRHRNRYYDYSRNVWLDPASIKQPKGCDPGHPIDSEPEPRGSILDLVNDDSDVDEDTNGDDNIDTSSSSDGIVEQACVNVSLTRGCHINAAYSSVCIHESKFLIDENGLDLLISISRVLDFLILNHLMS